MKTLLIFLFCLILIGCQKEYRCDILKTTALHDTIINTYSDYFYCDNDVSNNNCFNYILQRDDTIIIAKTICK